VRVDRRRLDRRPIPAHAGQPTGFSAVWLRLRAYPRARGATIWVCPCLTRQMGLSPRTRGNRSGKNRPAFLSGPIPAHAGQPYLQHRVFRQYRAYPRARGATFLPDGATADIQGLSPRTRGNPVEDAALCPEVGPIPAHAGQPPPSPVWRPSSGAYPRARGATLPSDAPGWFRAGLSPRTRGNQIAS